MFWLIYTRVNKLESNKAISFETFESMQEWFSEREDSVNVIDVTSSIDREED